MKELEIVSGAPGYFTLLVIPGECTVSAYGRLEKLYHLKASSDSLRTIADGGGGVETGGFLLSFGPFEALSAAGANTKT